ncbi:hypothetical protein MUK51_10850 [Sphingobacterium faecium]|uniref:hypothetical protein n=1 Tax=Sphingobacterium faecium TaxID=34087 RepID=UPI0021B6C272|nr:hypothetical protein [Sphingobacterium faecium]UXD67729.1 hypothetical protein MUK51_10850 [Sphingobacterium faecium]
MEYVKVTHAVLRELKKDRYNVLVTDSTNDDEDPKFIPEFKADLWGYLESLDGDLACAVIDDLLELNEDELKGSVLY